MSEVRGKLFGYGNSCFIQNTDVSARVINYMLHLLPEIAPKLFKNEDLHQTRLILWM